jgi:SM-20-related protein
MEVLEQIIRDIQVQGWSFQQEVVDKTTLEQLDSLFQEDFQPAKVGSQQNRQRNEEIRGDWIKWLDPLKPPQILQKEIKLLGDLQLLLNQHFYLGLREFECHLAKYPKGTFYKKHLDRFEKDSSRSFSFIFYLHQKWQNTDGGELIVYNEQNEVLSTISPEPGSMMCFLSDEFPHEVKTCHRERRSLTGWMHTKIIT